MLSAWDSESTMRSESVDCMPVLSITDLAIFMSLSNKLSW